MPIDRARYSFLAHAECDICNPIGDAKTEEAIRLLGELAKLSTSSTVLDIGAGKGEWVLRLARRFGVRATAIEPAPLFAAEIRARALARGLPEPVDVRECTAATFVERRPGAFDAVLCIGSLHAFGTLHATLHATKALTRPGGCVLIGAGYWRQPPAPEYLASFGGRADEMGTHASNVEAMLAQGLIPVWSCTASEDEFEEYEWRYSRGIERYVEAHPEDENAAAMLDRSRSWRGAFLTWGKATMGFGLYLARVPRA